jgi:hypothetical protein
MLSSRAASEIVGAGGGESMNRRPGTAHMRARVMFSLLVRMNSHPAMRSSTSASVEVGYSLIPGNTRSSWAVSRSS